MKLNRRALLVGGAASGIAACVPLDISPPGRLAAKLRIIEAAAGGTLGASIRNVATGQTLNYKSDQLFGHCSSFKLSLAALVLRLDQLGEIEATERIRWTKDDLMSYSPFTTKRLDDGATLLELAEATQTYSDNAAANILLRKLGGPERLTQFWRSLGDQTSRLDRTEPSLNIVPPGEVRDTTSPAAMALTLQNILFGDTLSPDYRTVLRQWMADTANGAKRVRAGLPDDWTSGDKTGTSLWPGMGSLYVDIGFATPPGGPPMTFAAYYRAKGSHSGMDPAAENVLRQVGKVLAEFGPLSQIT
jgi:beta-lactamase class A